MSFEEEFDKIIRQKSDEVEYPFDEKNWESAKGLMDADRKAARTLQFKNLLKPALAFTAIGSVVLISFIYLNQDTPSSSLIAEQQTQQISNKNQDLKAGTAVKTQNRTVQTAPKEEIRIPTSKETLISSVAPETNISNTTENIQNKPYLNSAQQEPTESKTDIHPADANITSTEPVVSVSAKAAMRDLPLVPNTGLPEMSLAATTLQTKENTDVLNSETATVESTSAETNENVSPEMQISIDYLTANSLSLPYESSEKSVELENIVPVKNDDYFKQKRKTHYLNIEAGTTYLTGWNTANVKDGKGFNYFGGFNYGFYLGNKLSIGIGVQAFNIAHMQNPYYISSHTDYDFGSTTIYTVVTCSELYYAALPLKINYKVNKSNTIGLGFTASYLLNANTQTESYYYLDNAKMPLGAPVNEKAIYEGVNQYNYMLSAQYGRRIGKRIGLNAELIYGLTDIFNNSALIANSERSTGIRLSLTYTIFDK